MDTKNLVAFTPRLFGKWDGEEVCKEESNGSILLSSSDLTLIRGNRRGWDKNERYAFNCQSLYKPDRKDVEVTLKYLSGPSSTLDVYFEMQIYKMFEDEPNSGELFTNLTMGEGKTFKKDGDEKIFPVPLEPLSRAHPVAPEQLTLQGHKFHTRLRMWLSPAKKSMVVEATLDETMQKLCLSTNLSDFIIKCDGKEFPTHKLILSARSDVFERMFSSALKINEKDEPILEIDDVSAEEMEIFLNFLYKDEIKDEDISCELLKLADKYNVKRLVSICLNHLKETIDIQNVVEITYTAFLTSKDELLQMASKFIFENRGSIKKGDVWNQIKKTHPEIAIKIMDLIVFDAKTDSNDSNSNNNV